MTHVCAQNKHFLGKCILIQENFVNIIRVTTFWQSRFAGAYDSFRGIISVQLSESTLMRKMSLACCYVTAILTTAFRLAVHVGHRQMSLLNNFYD